MGKAAISRKTAPKVHYPRHMEDRDELYDRLYEIAEIAANSIKSDGIISDFDYEPHMSERIMYYFVTLCFFEDIDIIHIIEFCINNFSAVCTPGAIANIKLLVEMLKD